MKISELQVQHNMNESHKHSVEPKNAHKILQAIWLHLFKILK